MGTGVLTESFTRQNGALCIDDVPLSAIARDVGTPAFVYSAAHIRARYHALASALAGIPHRVHYSLKANSCRAVLGVLRDVGSGADVVSGGELFRAARAGFRPPDIIFGGVGKSTREIEEAIASSVKLLNVESIAELELVDKLARRLGRTARVGLRVNPEVAVESAHEYTKTGERGNKFGIAYDETEAAIMLALKLRSVRLCGIVMHVGSQLRTLDAHRRGAERLLALVDTARAAGAAHLAYLDIGGGLPVTYSDEPSADIDGFAEIARDAATRSGLEILVEPGRFLVANSGVLLTRVLYRKRSGGTEYVVVDAGMTELVRPSHYDAFHAIEAVELRDGELVADIVGPVCESGDFLAKGRTISAVEARDLLAVQSAGAYGFVMASHYNARPRAAEVIVDGGQWALSTARETYADLVRHERAHLDWRRAE
ncbi:MAG TPA: diaminopimelate decarboxylase [Gemmatimonadaceae bacterium]|nr:diaminopimelate decarboxylase [Gemmatimonadaceae bacterium]